MAHDDDVVHLVPALLMCMHVNVQVETAVKHVRRFIAITAGLMQQLCQEPLGI